MKKIIFLIVLVGVFIFSSFVEAKTVRVSGYYKSKTGTYVTPYYKTSSNKTKLDNFSVKGNYNPYTGKSGTVNPFKFK